MKSKMEIAASVAQALYPESNSLDKITKYFMDEISSGNAQNIYEKLQNRFGSAQAMYSKEKAWKYMQPVAKAMDDLWEIVSSDILASDGITDVRTDTAYITLKTIRFWYENNPFCVDIILDTEEEKYESWLYADGFAIKEYMFGSMVNSYRFGQPTTETLESFTNMVLANVAEYLPDYMEKHMDQ